MKMKELTVSRERKAKVPGTSDETVGVSLSLTVELEEGDGFDLVIEELYDRLREKENQLLGIND